VLINVSVVFVFGFGMSCELIKSMIDYNDVMRHNYKFQLLKEFGFLIKKNIGGIHILVVVCYDSKK
jgi:hypothetical protein